MLFHVLWRARLIHSVSLVNLDLKVTVIGFSGLLHIAVEKKKCSLQTWLTNEARQLYQPVPKRLVIRTTHPTSHNVPTIMDSSWMSFYASNNQRAI